MTAPAQVLLDDLRIMYEDLHAHPELGFTEVRTAGILADRLEALGYEVARGVGRTGVVAVLDNGPGPTVLCRADIDAVPLTEDTGLPYASTTRTTQEDGGEVGVAHACGHDMHATWLVGAASELIDCRDLWSGKLVLVLQPAEELGEGAMAMLDDGLFERFGKPDVTLGQHTAPAPAGLILHRSGPAMAASDELRVVLHGRGGHGSSPHTTVDPAVLAASTIMRLQTIVSREIEPAQTAVVTVGTVRVGTKANVIADTAELSINIRSYLPEIRHQILDAIERIVEGECKAAGCPRPPEISPPRTLPALDNDAEAMARVVEALSSRIENCMIMEGPVVTGSEDFGHFAEQAGCPCAFWFVGVVDSDLFSRAFAAGRLAEDVPFNHSPRFCPVPDPSIRVGVEAMTAAALAWLGTDTDT